MIMRIALLLACTAKVKCVIIRPGYLLLHRFDYAFTESIFSGIFLVRLINRAARWLISGTVM
ncbi:hypothetical protein [Raoultella sp. 10-1]|uniref:hypothetical protein n=1 Tax=Raoultella sp. 10-1 TaxID=2683201 RepID=UPI001177F458|nr:MULTISPECIES: hypothetical protein [Enterobacteriaceae]MVT05947.1 hypothetical protein [Raoultella sp. 10-1]